MNLLTFDMPRYSRIQFVSLEAKDYWDSKLTEAAKPLKEFRQLKIDIPDCCKKGHGVVDPLFQQAQKMKPEYIKVMKEHHIRVKKNAPWELNTFLKPLGIAVLPFLPCSHDCQEALKVAKELLKKEVEGLDELKLVLSMPVEWNALKGIAYISTPIFKVESNSVTCFPKYVVQKEGNFIPKESAKGLKFPFNEAMGISFNTCKGG